MMQAMAVVLCAALGIGLADDQPAKAPSAKKVEARKTPTSEVRIDSGPVRGLIVGEKQDIHAFKGIPYAAPPVGDKRWQPPQPVAAWQQVRDCFEFGAACPQKVAGLFGRIPELALQVPMKEDCLYLNVWAPAENKGEKLPVLYWIHGGGFVMGAASQPIYDGEELARLGCVVVSINYRLGPLGFLAHPALSAESADKISGNYGLLDQIQGLRWVKKNVAAFGGDPERVTIFGESAGGISVLCLMVTPETRGLFHGAIAQSATGMLLPRLRDPHPGVESAEQAGQKLMSACGLKEEADAGQMRKLSVEALLAPMPSEMSTGSALHLKPRAMLLGPIVDGHVIPDMPNLIFASGHEHEVPLIVGNTKDEMSLMLMGNKMPADEAAYVKQLQEDFGESADGLAKAYPVREQKDIRVAVIQLASDATFIKESRFIARTHATAKQKTYRYEFAHGTKQGFLRALGAHHGSELAFVFQRPAGRNDPVDMKLALAMGRYWVNFAASGNPNGSDLPRWPAYQTDSEETIVFGENVDVAKGPRNAQLDEIEKALPSQNP